MNAPRIALERTTASLLFSRFTIPSSHSIRPCQHILRQFSQSQSWSASSEKLQATSAYHPYPLSRPPPPPPRNDDIPETSIATPVPKVHETRPPQQPATTSPPSSAHATSQITAASIDEQEAQKTKPVAPPERKRKLRPRKAAMKLTSSAVEHLREMLEGPEPKLIKVGVRNRGCSGLAYHLDYVDKPSAFDEEVEQDGVKVLIDSKALFSIIGSEMDWVEDKLNQRFVFTNPNIKEECGCGESFMV
ncbi:Fe-S cluster assembly protein SufA [Xylariales sp. AK1849]|nr:Fe-S cluster assembly protein SufA [Xylariales sp. AK1849]